MTFIYYHSNYDPKLRIIYVFISRNDYSISEAIVNDKWPTTVDLMSQHTGNIKPFTLNGQYSISKWMKLRLPVYYNKELGVKVKLEFGGEYD